MGRAKVTDRALRYRANSVELPGPRVCMFCGDDSPLDRAHIDGHEENTAPENLGYTCRSCNVICANVLRAAQLGRLTNQYNAGPARNASHYGKCVASMLGRSREISLPSAVRTLQNTPHAKRAEYARKLRNPGAANLAAYAEAVANHTRGAHDAGGAIIHATPKAKRREFAAMIADTKRARYGSASDSMPDWARNPAAKGTAPKGSAKKRRNPAEAAAEVFEGFHGYPSAETVVIEREHHFHEHVAGVGELVCLLVVPLFEEKAEGVNDRCVKLSGFTDENGIAFLTCNEKRSQLFIDGGDQSVNVDAFNLGAAADHESVVLGKAVRVDYYTVKTHLGREGGEAVYQHIFGEYRDSNNRRKFKGKAARPFVIYDTLNRVLSFSGGDYTIPNEGISE